LYSASKYLVLGVDVVKYMHLYHTRQNKIRATENYKQLQWEFRPRRISSCCRKWECGAYEAGNMAIHEVHLKKMENSLGKENSMIVMRRREWEWSS
jgi:hypothetical protein